VCVCVCVWLRVQGFEGSVNKEFLTVNELYNKEIVLSLMTNLN
jgi:hypothetical protein